MLILVLFWVPVIAEGQKKVIKKQTKNQTPELMRFSRLRCVTVLVEFRNVFSIEPEILVGFLLFHVK